MKKGFWVFIIILLFAASAYVYKLNLDKQEAIATGENQTGLLANLDNFENIYFWIFGVVGVIVVLFVALAMIRKKSYE